jgi:deoxyribodipyrimidine photo-lyase
MPSRAVVWFRRDLRVADHPALLAAVDAADAVWCSGDLTPYARRRDTAVEQALRADGRRLHALPGNYLSDFDEVRTTGGDPFRIYSPFARAAKAAAWDDPVPAPGRVRVPEELGGAELAGFDLDGAVETPPPDPAAALERLAWFVANRVDSYGRARNVMATDGTSKLSLYLRFRLVSPRQVAAAVTTPGTRGEGGGDRRRAAEHPRRAGDRETFVNELLRRDFYAYVLYHQPESAWRHMRPEFAHFEFEDDPDGLAAWREGRTGSQWSL